MKDDLTKMNPRKQLHGHKMHCHAKRFQKLCDSLVDNIFQASYHTQIAWVHLNTIREGEEMVRQGQILGNPCMAQK